MRIAFLLLLTLAASHAEEFGRTWWHGRLVTYKVRNSVAIYQGDIVLGKTSDLKEQRPFPANDQDRVPHPDAAFLTGAENSDLWPNGVVPYVIDNSVTGNLLSAVMQAMQTYNNNTPVKWTARTNQANYVQFTTEPTDSDECGDSYIGVNGGKQQIVLNPDPSCGLVGSALHEMGHALGFEHEQTRFDRDYYVNILWQNLDKNTLSQYQRDLGQVDLLPYNQASIMHYGAEDDERVDLPTLTTIPPGIPVAHRSSLSAGDIEAVRTAYGAPSSTTTVYTDPPGLNVIVDGQSVKTPMTFTWAPGSTHTLDIADGYQSGGPRTRYAFARWSNDGPLSQTIAASPQTRVICANFAAQYLVTASVSKAGGGTVTVSPSSADGFYTFGTQVTVTATPDPGYTFLQWDNPNSISIYHGVSSSPASFVVDSAGWAYTADFTKSQLTSIGTNIPGTEVNVDGNATSLPANFAWTAGSKHTVAVATKSQDSGSVGSPYRWTFQSWGDGGAVSHSITAGSTSTTLASTWQQEWLVSTYAADVDNPYSSANGKLTVSPASSSCGNPTPTDCYYAAGTTLTFTPAPNAPYVFAGWSNDLGGSTVPGSLTINDQVYLTANFAKPGLLSDYAIVNAASYDNQGVSPGELVTIFGLNFGPPAQLTGAQLNGNAVATQLAQTQVLFDGRAAPLIYVSANQISAIVPYEVAGEASTRVVIVYQGTRGNAVSMPVMTTHPGLFTLDSSGSGLVVALNQDNSVHGVNNPAVRGTVLQLYGTGMGVTTPASADGRIAGPPYASTSAPVSVTIAGRNAKVQYFGAAPGLANGLFQANVVVPPDCPTGLVPISISIGDNASPAVTRVMVQ
ncbi:MAG TPA: M12 family metallopeptidase [Bryobacteraceae bacterium]